MRYTTDVYMNNAVDRRMQSTERHRFMKSLRSQILKIYDAPEWAQDSRSRGRMFESRRGQDSVAIFTFLYGKEPRNQASRGMNQI